MWKCLSFGSNQDSLSCKRGDAKLCGGFALKLKVQITCLRSNLDVELFLLHHFIFCFFIIFNSNDACFSIVNIFYLVHFQELRDLWFHCS